MYLKGECIRKKEEMRAQNNQILEKKKERLERTRKDGKDISKVMLLEYKLP